ncbi:MAG: sarcosine oxidase subunit delta [Rhodobiaceae bacterium]|nr:sarcosine oxidase subunit delta [Rhodobiaceae bacterium]
MLLIECPFCGPRAETEFHCGGQAHIVRPDNSVDDVAWEKYLFIRNNPKGVHAERWVHNHGCGRWFNALRDTVSDRILAIYAMGEQPPSPDDLKSGNVQR